MITHLSDAGVVSGEGAGEPVGGGGELIQSGDHQKLVGTQPGGGHVVTRDKPIGGRRRPSKGQTAAGSTRRFNRPRPLSTASTRPASARPPTGGSSACKGPVARGLSVKARSFRVKELWGGDLRRQCFVGQRQRDRLANPRPAIGDQGEGD